MYSLVDCTHWVLSFWDVLLLLGKFLLNFRDLR